MRMMRILRMLVLLRERMVVNKKSRCSRRSTVIWIRIKIGSKGNGLVEIIAMMKSMKWIVTLTLINLALIEATQCWSIGMGKKTQLISLKGINHKRRREIKVSIKDINMGNQGPSI